MKTSFKIGCVLLAAGNGSRFGANKLAMDFRGQSLFSRALSAIPADQLAAVSVVTQYLEFECLVKEKGFTFILNSAPELGQSHSLQLGLSSLASCDGVLFQVSDQPLLKRESVTALLRLWKTQPEKIAALAQHGKRGSPCLFPARFFGELMAITGDQGGSVVIRKHPEELLLLEVPPEELLDVDTVQALHRLEQL